MARIHLAGKIQLASLIFVILFWIRPAEAAKIDTLVVMSEAMHKPITNIVIVPDAYQTQEGNFPSLYMLHGATDDYTSWLYISPDLPHFADQYNMIIVLPDGGSTSWYFDSPIDPEMQYETYVTSELIKVVDTKYRTDARRARRAVTGLSMGGHGAFYLALRHPQIWGAAGSMSGGLDFRPFPTKWDIALRLGPYSDNKEVWDQHTVLNMLELAKKADVQLIFDCGVDDFFIEGNRQVHTKLLQLKVPHDYTERPGGHKLEYWQNAVKYQLLFFAEYFKS